ncbi:succinyl-CoA ligase [GDP-forming] subunit beta, mitochondrial [Tachysurus ichikawai]
METERVSSAAAAFLRPSRVRPIGRDVLGARGVPKGTSAPVLQRPHRFHLMLIQEDEKLTKRNLWNLFLQAIPGELMMIISVEPVPHRGVRSPCGAPYSSGSRQQLESTAITAAEPTIPERGTSEHAVTHSPSGCLIIPELVRMSPRRWLNLQEYQSKKLMQECGVAVQRFFVADTGAEALEAAKRLKSSLPVSSVVPAKPGAGCQKVMRGGHVRAEFREALYPDFVTDTIISISIEAHTMIHSGSLRVEVTKRDANGFLSARYSCELFLLRDVPDTHSFCSLTDLVLPMLQCS